MPLPDHIQIPFQGCLLVLTRAEYLAAVHRGKAFRRARQIRRREAGRKAPTDREGHMLAGLFEERAC